MAALGLSPGKGWCFEELSCSVESAVVFSLVGHGAGAELSLVGSMRAVRLMWTLLILIAVADGVCTWGVCVCSSLASSSASAEASLWERPHDM